MFDERICVYRTHERTILVLPYTKQVNYFLMKKILYSNIQDMYLILELSLNVINPNQHTQTRTDFIHKTRNTIAQARAILAYLQPLSHRRLHEYIYIFIYT
jgi:hypothetical protein